jgi:hypothetical protein
MHQRFFHLPFIIALAFAGCNLSGCGSINDRISAGVADTIPQWAGGLPRDAPPRPGTPQYDAYMKERESKRLEPAPPKDAASEPPSGLEPVH